MTALLRLLSRLGPLFLFLLLESISLYLVVTYNTEQGRLFLSSTNRFTSFINRQVSGVTGYANLREENQELVEEIIDLRERLGNAYYDNTASIDTALADSSALPLYTYIDARVINNSISRKNNYLTLNKGSKHGLRPHMGVISNDGVVGIVRQVSPHYAMVMSVLHSKTRITAEIRDKGYFGALVWKEQDPRFMYLEDVPKHHFIELGDTVQTSRFSHIFPEGIALGEIADFSVPEGGSNFNIKVRLNTEMGRLRQVLVVNNLMSEEIEQLEEGVLNE
jgi:rod shape-determining protein MreC